VPLAGSGVGRTDPFHVLVGCRKRQINLLTASQYWLILLLCHLAVVFISADN